MAPKRGETGWFDDALAFAVRAHSGFVRRGSGVPFVVHPIEVALILQRHEFARAVVVAGLLHDVVEDTAVTLPRLEARFGASVARLVDLVTERKRDARGAPRAWRVRKEEQLARLSRAPREAIALKAADSLQNANAILEECARQEPGGDQVWAHFAAGPLEEAWYFRAVAELVHRRLAEHPLALELIVAVAELRARAAEACEDAPAPQRFGAVPRRRESAAGEREHGE